MQYREEDSQWRQRSHSGKGTRTTITSLTTGKEYQVRVAATNAAGTSGWVTSSTLYLRDP